MLTTCPEMKLAGRVLAWHGDASSACVLEPRKPDVVKMPMIPVLGRWKPVDQKSKITSAYIMMARTELCHMRHYLKTKKEICFKSKSSLKRSWGIDTVNMSMRGASQIHFLAPTSGVSQLLVTPISRILIPSSVSSDTCMRT